MVIEPRKLDVYLEVSPEQATEVLAQLVILDFVQLSCDASSQGIVKCYLRSTPRLGPHCQWRT